jgi:hypothetical protein
VKDLIKRSKPSSPGRTPIPSRCVGPSRPTTSWRPIERFCRRTLDVHAPSG